MHADEVDVDAGLVRRLVAAQFPDWARLPVEPVEPRGTDNALYRLGDDMVARLPSTERTVATLEKEREWLPRLAPFLPLAVPAPLADGAPGVGYPFVWSVYSWLPGTTVVEAPLADLGRAARDLAGFLRALQGIDATDGPPPGAHNFGRGGRLAPRDGSVRASIEALRDELDVDATTSLWEAALAAPEWEGPPVWVHGDLDARNVLVQDGRLSGVIDWGGLGVGDPASDVMVAWKLFSAESRGIFRAALGVDDDTWARAYGWALSQAVVALAYYTPATNAVLFGEARRWLAEVLADA
jgi:aminoglycoside phosphotransferase (APT) family kinase protein